MSAYVLGDDNFDAILTACKVNNFYHPEKDLNAIGQQLKDQNYRSVNAKYNEKEESTSYKFKLSAKVYSPVELLKICDCYEYQACETADYKESEAFKAIDFIRRKLITLLTGYKDAKWGL